MDIIELPSDIDAGLDLPLFSARFSGSIAPETSGWHVLYLNVIGSARMIVDGVVVASTINDPSFETGSHTPYTMSASVHFQGGRVAPYPIQIDYQSPFEAPFQCTLEWSGPQFIRQPVPSWILGYYTGASANNAPLVCEQLQNCSQGCSSVDPCVDKVPSPTPDNASTVTCPVVVL